MLLTGRLPSITGTVLDRAGHHGTHAAILRYKTPGRGAHQREPSRVMVARLRLNRRSAVVRIKLICQGSLQPSGVRWQRWWQLA